MEVDVDMQGRHGRRRRAWSLGALLALVAALVALPGCLWMRDPASQQLRQMRRVWPPSPGEGRIELVATILLMPNQKLQLWYSLLLLVRLQINQPNFLLCLRLMARYTHMLLF